jgi:DNA processing protein
MNVDETLDLLAIALLPGVGARTARDLAARGPLARVLAHPGEYADHLPPAAREALRGGRARARAEAELAAAERRGVRVVGWDEPDYPERLRRIYDPPPVLYVRGRLQPGEGERAVAIVGSRAASPHGRSLARGMARDLAGAGLTIVSGLARGIDTAAHRGALEAGGRTVALLGSGLDRIYPDENTDLAEEIARAGAVVSEFPLGSAPDRKHFPRRNRLIAGWGRAVVVAEAAQKSGALLTAQAALEEGREVMAVPGHPCAPGSAGTNQLIRDGAVLVRDAADVAEELGVSLRPPVEAVPTDDDVLRALARDVPRSLEELQARSGRALPELLSHLTLLEVGAQVRRLPGPLFVRT